MGSLAVGVLIGAAIGLALAYAPLRMIASGPIFVALLAMPVVGAVAAARSRDLAAARIGAAGRPLT
ncbi:hypothetical protein ACFY0R_16080 [Streptomyces sp. NPDC001633]|uniref:hypothetical protein n=1 Tax=Streptomyces sp. NPDC001633 TaxID=3364595 RepID=UPI0036A63D5E